MLMNENITAPMRHAGNQPSNLRGSAGRNK